MLQQEMEGYDTETETSGREVSHGPILEIFFFEQISRNERFMKKVDF